MSNGNDSAWSPASARLTTPWSADVTPESVRSEYPRPMLVRDQWQSLNGVWQFAFDDANVGAGAGWSSGTELPERILVPFTFEASLSGIGLGEEIHERVWYRRHFTTPVAWTEDSRRVLLHFGAVDWHTEVFLNGTLLGEHTGGYTPFSFDITDALRIGDDADQELVVAVWDPSDPAGEGYQPRGKQLGTEGIWYTRTTGIWQSVWIEPVSETFLSGLRTECLIGEGLLYLHCHIGDGSDADVHVEASLNGAIVAKGSAAISSYGVVTMQVDDPLLWSPETPVLYDLKVTIVKGTEVTDTVVSYTAFRSVGIANGRLLLNGEPYFYRGVLDQGYWPDGILTAPTDDALRFDVETVKRLGFNLARKHVKIEDPRWYYWCDRLGVAVWQDMPSSHNLSRPEARANFTAEWIEVMATTRGYPCLLHWIPINENWGDPGEFQDELFLLTRSIDPSRPITDASGWTQRGLTDIIDVHDYGNSLLRHGVENPDKPRVVGEFGGIALPVPGHTWAAGWGYQTAKDAEGLVKGICFQTTQLFEAPDLSGFVYTQLSDVELELNGLLTYDRLPKAAYVAFAADFTGAERSYTPPEVVEK